MSITYAPLPTQTWGDLMKNCRNTAGMSLADAERLVRAFVPTSDNSLNRLEHISEPPRQSRTRQLALYALIAYSLDQIGPFNPSEFGLSYDEIPAGVGTVTDVRKRMKRIRDQHIRESRCIPGNAGHSLAA